MGAYSGKKRRNCPHSIEKNTQAGKTKVDLPSRKGRRCPCPRCSYSPPFLPERDCLFAASSRCLEPARGANNDLHHPASHVILLCFFVFSGPRDFDPCTYLRDRWGGLTRLGSKIPKVSRRLHDSQLLRHTARLKYAPALGIEYISFPEVVYLYHTAFVQQAETNFRVDSCTISYFARHADSFVHVSDGSNALGKRRLHVHSLHQRIYIHLRNSTSSFMCRAYSFQNGSSAPPAAMLILEAPPGWLAMNSVMSYTPPA